MNVKQLKIFPFHTFLIPIFFVWHIYNDYFGLFPFRYNAKYILCYLCLALVLFCIGWLFFRNKIKGGCWATFLLIIFFGWGAFHDLLKSLQAPALFTSYTFLLSLIFVLLIFVTWKLRKRQAPFQLNRFLNILFAFFLLLEAGVSVYRFATNEHFRNDLSHNTRVKTSLKHLADTTKPDIFFIIFDEYASSIALEKFLHWNNRETDSILKQNGFYIATHSKSNYNSTPHSIASTLNFSYIDQPLGEVKTNPKALLRAQYTITKSQLPQLLEQHGYEIRNYGLCDLDGHPYTRTPIFNPDIEDALYNETFWARIQKELSWRFPGWLASATIRQSFESKKKEHITTIQYHQQQIIEELQTQASTPKFVFVHLLLPHDPYCFDKNGRQREASFRDDSIGTRDSLYIEQLQFVNRSISQIAELANQPHQRPRVVIVEGDHGRRDDPGSPLFNYDKQFMNLSTFYFSDKDYSGLYDSISPVNSFRVVLNKYFNAGLPLLKDSTILLH